MSLPAAEQRWLSFVASYLPHLIHLIFLCLCEVNFMLKLKTREGFSIVCTLEVLF